MRNTILSASEQNPASYRRHYRWIILITVLTSFYILAKHSGVFDNLSPEQLRDQVEQWGAYGVIFYLLLFTIGQLVHVPGLIFVTAAALAYGQWLGFTYAMIGATLAASVSFFIVRSLGGTPLAKTRARWINRMMSHLHIRPLSSILVMRTVFASAPWLNYLLAMSAVKYRYYLAGSVLGFIPQYFLATYYTQWIIQHIL